MRLHKTAGVVLFVSVLLSMSGLVVAQAASLSPNPLSFGNQLILTTSVSRSVTLKNTGTATLQITGITPPIAPFSETSTSCSGSLLPGKSCTISVTFSPTKTGDFKGSISIADNATGSPQIVSLKGTGVPQAALSPNPLIFGLVGVGSTSTAETATLQNNLNTSLTITSIAASGDFAVPSNTCGSSVPAGGQCQIAVTFTPTQLGIRSGSLTVRDSANNSPQTISLVGAGTFAGLISISVTPANVSIPVGSTQQFTATGTFPTGIRLNLTQLVLWSSSASNVATISNSLGSQGLATGNAAGTTTIKATSINNVSGATSLSVGSKAAATVTLSNLTQTYNGTLKPVTVTTIPSGLAVTVTYNGSSIVPTNAGSYSVVATVNDPNYQGSANGTLTVNKAAATVTLGNLMQTYTGGALTPTAATVPANLTVTWTGAPDTNAGSYSVTATVSDPNYSGSASGTFVISKAAATVTLGSLTQTYTGSPLTPTAATVPANLTVTWTGAPDTNAGSYSVTATVTDPNYKGSASGSFVVSQATPTISVTGGTFAYDGNQHAATTTATGVGGASVSGSFTFTYNGASATPIAAGTYTVAATFTSSDPNYSGASGAGSITITAPAVTLVSIAITPANPSVTIGGTQQFTATGTYSDNSTQILTSTATWTSSATKFATVSNTSPTQGLATAVSLGVTTITATVGLIQGSTNLAVTGTGTFVFTGNMQLDRDPFTATLLPDGRVLIAGGYSSGGITNSTELYDSAGTASSAGATMQNARADHTATLLNNGKVLIVGGYSPAVLGSAEIYDGTSFSPTGPLITARAQHTATLLQDGQVLIVGGNGASGVLASAELYSPTTGLFTTVGSLATARYAHTATLLNDGTVLIAGGATNSTPTPTAAAELYSPATRSFSSVNSMNSPRAFYTATLLNDGTVLMAGGLVDTVPNLTATAELYSAGSFTPVNGAMSSPRAAHTATLLSNGAVLIAGGAMDNTGNFPPIGTPTGTVDLYDPYLYFPPSFGNGFSGSSTLVTARSQHTATLLTSGAVLIAGGTTDNIGTTTNTAELYSTPSFSPYALQTITIAPATSALGVGTSQRFVATGTFSSNGTSYTQQLATPTWTSTDVSGTNVAQIGNDSTNQGVALALAPGTATIAANLGTVTGKAAITVSALNTLTVTPINPTIPLGTTQQFIAIANGTQDLTAQVVWSSNGVATINSSGLASSTIQGPSTIMATFGGFNPTTTLTVGPPALVSIAVNPVMPIQVNGSQQFTAVGTYTDGSTQPDLSTTATPASWTSLDPIVAQIGLTTGLAVGNNIGQTTVTATVGTLSNSTTLYVTNVLLSGSCSGCSMNVPRVSHRAVVLDSGKVLLTGGIVSNPGAHVATNTAELYDPTGAVFSVTGSMSTPRQSHSATVLNNGQVLIAGGRNDSPGAVINIWASAELYDPSGTFTATGSLQQARDVHTATRLNDGTVLIAGGHYLDSNGLNEVVFDSAEIYSSGTFGYTHDSLGSQTRMSTPRKQHSATLLNNGKVLIAGGLSLTGVPLNTAELYDPATGTFTPTANSVPNLGNVSALLEDGTVLFVGSDGTGAHILTEIYDPNTNMFIANSPIPTATATFLGGPGTLLDNGMVVLTGVGAILNGGIGTELYDPAAQTFTATGSLNQGRILYTQNLLNTGSVLLTGGIAAGPANPVLTSAELYPPSTLPPDSSFPRYLTGITVAPANQSTQTIATGTAQQFIATGTFNNNGTIYMQQLASVIWSSTDLSGTNVTQISNDVSNPGVAVGISTGTATIKACAGTVCGSAILSVQ